MIIISMKVEPDHSEILVKKESKLIFVMHQRGFFISMYIFIYIPTQFTYKNKIIILKMQMSGIEYFGWKLIKADKNLFKRR